MFGVVLLVQYVLLLESPSLAFRRGDVEVSLSSGFVLGMADLIQLSRAKSYFPGNSLEERWFSFNQCWALVLWVRVVGWAVQDDKAFTIGPKNVWETWCLRGLVVSGTIFVWLESGVPAQYRFAEDCVPRLSCGEFHHVRPGSRDREGPKALMLFYIGKGFDDVQRLVYFS